jgi:cysteinyl-tRNA synthetase
MSLRIYNTMTRKKEEFNPLQKGKVGVYSCGVTVYDLCHVGHARSAIVFDVITRYLRYRGYEVTYVKNFTDVDDKIINRANREGVAFSDISEKYIREHNDDMDDLGIIRPTITPKATESIGGMIKLISTLIEKDLAYVVDGDVYYSVSRFPGYGKLSGRSLDEMIAGARVEVGEKKKDPLDFALWKASKPGEPSWESPWGKGRPGWHIECSVMSQEYLGATFDIHGGGEDLIFPHHENEIAQSEGVTGRPFARYWMHNGFVKINSEKMSKSLGNFVLIRDVLKLYHREVLRFFVLQSHYKSPLDFSEDSLSEAKVALDRVYAALQRIRNILGRDHAMSDISAGEGDLSGGDLSVFEKIKRLPERFVEAMDDDFNTARAIGYVFEAVRLINSYLGEGFQDRAASRFVLNSTEQIIREIGQVLGLFLEDPGVYVEQGRVREARNLVFDVEEVDRLIEERNAARRSRDWKKADEIRQALAARGVTLKDTPTGTTWGIEKPKR